jgi:toxin ParE1/3/4
VTRSVLFRPGAEDDLLTLYRYIADSSGAARADAYVTRIEQACMALAPFPERGTRRDDLAPGLRTIGFERRVTIAFRVLDHAVEIIAIAYAGRDFESGLR